MITNYFKKIFVFASITVFIFSFISTPKASADFSSGTATNVIANTSIKLEPLVHVDQDAEDLKSGSSDRASLGGIYRSNDGIKIGKSYNYTKSSNPSISESNGAVSSLDVDPNTGYLYVGTQYGGLYVINLETNTTIRRYTTTTSPAIPSVTATYESFFHPVTGYLYVATFGGVAVIDLENDTLIKTYTTASTPALPNNRVQDLYHDSVNNYLYMSTYGGVAVLDLTNDTIVKTYTTATNPAISSNSVRHSFVDLNTNYLYVSTYASSGGSLSVIDLTNNTLLKTYSSALTPEIITNASPYIMKSYINPNDNYLYLTTGGGIFVVDQTSDILVRSYGATTSPSIYYNFLYDSYLDPSTNYLYANTAAFGVTVVDLNNNTVVKRYAINSQPSTVGNSGLKTLFDDESNKLFIGSWEGLSIIDLNDKYNLTGSYTSLPVRIQSDTFKKMEWQNNTSSGQNVSLSYRTGSSTAVWFDDFDDGTPSVTGNPYSSIFKISLYNKTEEKDGKLIFSDLNGTDTSAIIFIETGITDNSFSSSSVSRLKIKNNISNSSTALTQFWLVTQSGGSARGSYSEDVNKWIYLDSSFFSSGAGFSKFALYTDGILNPILSTDSLELDYISIELPTGWGEWQTCSSNPCDVTVGAQDEWIQYKATLTTTDTSSTPTLTSVSLRSEYNTSGTYISDVADGGGLTDWKTLDISSTTPTGTSINISTRGGDIASPDSTWTEWQGLSDSDIQTPDRRYMQYKIDLSTTDSNITPEITSIGVNYDTQTRQGSSSRSSSYSQVKNSIINSAEQNIKSLASILNKAKEDLSKLINQMKQMGLSVPKEAEDILINMGLSLFTRDLTLNSIGSDVKELQKYLNLKGFIVSNTGAGSPGNETEYFGPATQSALIKYQISQNISPAVGYFGPVTRGILSKNK